MDSIGERIKREREKLGISQKELAEAIHIRNTTVSKWEKTSNVPVDKIIILAHLFKVSCDYLLLGVGTEKLETHYETWLSEKSISEFINNEGLSACMNYLAENECVNLIKSIVLYLRVSIKERKDKNILTEKTDGINLGLLIGDIIEAREAILSKEVNNEKNRK